MQTSKDASVAAKSDKFLPPYCTESVLFGIKFKRAHVDMSNDSEHRTRISGAGVATVTEAHGAAGENNRSTWRVPLATLVPRRAAL